jgi:hypothetical protein
MIEEKNNLITKTAGAHEWLCFIGHTTLLLFLNFLTYKGRGIGALESEVNMLRGFLMINCNQNKQTSVLVDDT